MWTMLKTSLFGVNAADTFLCRTVVVVSWCGLFLLLMNQIILWFWRRRKTKSFYCLFFMCYRYEWQRLFSYGFQILFWNGDIHWKLKVDFIVINALIKQWLDIVDNNENNKTLLFIITSLGKCRFGFVKTFNCFVCK